MIFQPFSDGSMKNGRDLARFIVHQAQSGLLLSRGKGEAIRLLDAIATARSLLTHAKVATDDIVAIQLRDPVWFLGVLIHIWERGAIPFIVDHRLSTPARADVWKAIGPQIEVVQHALDDHPVISRLPRLQSTADYSDVLMVQLTSGTTGKSRLVRRDMASVLNELNAYLKLSYLEAGVQEVLLACSPVHTFGLIAGVLSGIFAGKNLGFMQQLTRNELAHGRSGSVVSLISVPSVLELLSRFGSVEGLGSIRHTLFAGERLSGGLAQTLGESRCRTVNVFGTTEVGLLASSIGQKDLTVLSSSGTRQLQICDNKLEVGMLRSPYVGVNEIEGWNAGWFRSGDVVEPVASASDCPAFRIVGRLDSQVKVSGLKINLSRIEDAAASTGLCVGSVASLSLRIELFVELAAGAGRKDFERSLNSRLEPWERPMRIRYLRDFPRTYGGKVLRDRNLLLEAPEAS